uniref:Uncharacterized protein n=1 Tax=Pristionchus pacificus TaxID=54126 RepID=A0A2A6C7B7_PRIPA|eukprot:PDM73958.1 hypothetical protein PRIPAC_41314 [Pristionchus pacificus]
MSAQISFVAVIAARLNSLSGSSGVRCDVVNVVVVVEGDVDDDDVIEGVVKVVDEGEGGGIVDVIGEADVVRGAVRVVVDAGASEGVVVSVAIVEVWAVSRGGAEVVIDS